MLRCLKTFLTPIAMTLLALGAPANAQESPLPDRRVVTTTGQDFYGADIGSIFETTFKACREACQGNPACRALTYNTRAEACFLKSGIERREPFANAVSAEMIETTAAAKERAAIRAAELDFVTERMFDRARTLAATLGGRVAANGSDPDALISAGLSAEQEGNLTAAAQNFGAAVTLADQPGAWRDLARVWLAIKGKNSSQTRGFRRDALGAAINAYLRSDSAPEQATTLNILADALEKRGHGRRMIDALRRSLVLSPRRETTQKLAYAVSNYGFRVTGHNVDSDSATARICVDFSEDLAGAGIDYASYVRVDGTDTLPVEVEGRQLCVDGVTRGERYALKIRQGLPSGEGELLAKSVEIEAYIRDRSPSVRFAGRAYVLPKSADAAIPVVTVNLSEVDIAIHRIGERSLVPAIQNELFDKALNRWRERQLAGSQGEAVWTGKAEVEGPVNADVTTALPIGAAIRGFRPGIYAMTARVPGDTSDWDRAATQWFVVTDLGLASMSGADGLHAFVRSLATAEPVAGAEVALVAKNNDVLGTAVTDNAGYARFDPGLARGRGGAAPAMLSVQHKGDLAFVDLARPGFDLSDRGVEGRAAPGPVDVYATTERGVYRPGEVVHLTALARDARADALRDLPLTLVVSRPDGVEYHRALLSDQGAGGRAHSLRLGAGVPRGTWRAKLHTDPKAAAVAQLSFLVEDFVPEKLDVTLSAPEGLVSANQPVEIAVNTRYLYGAPGADLPVETELRLSPADGLPGYPGYAFGLADEETAVSSERLGTVNTDENGDARITLAAPAGTTSTRPMQLTAIVQVRESSGRPVERQLTRPLAPVQTQIGIRPLFEGQAEEGASAGFEVIAVGPDGTQTALPRAGWTLNKLNTSWQWYELNGRWNYESTTRRERIANGEITLGADGPAAIEAPVEWGAYELKIAALDGSRTVASYRFNSGWYTGGAATDTPDVLEIGLDKARYRLGETVTVRLKPRAAGKVLLSVVDNRLIEMKTIDVAPGETTATLTVTEDWGPGAYITATLIRPMDVAAKRNPSRALGLAWATVEPEGRQLEVTVTTPDEVAPRGPMTAAVSIEGIPAGETAHVTLAAVDLGILNLTGFQPPDPARHYFGQRALGMEMRDLYGRLIDGMQGVRGRMRSGGDAEAKRLSAVPPTEELVAYFSGVVTVGPDGTAQTTFEMPDFNGTVRISAIAWSASAVGSASKDVLVRDPVVVSAATPRFLAPRDQTRLLIDLALASGPAGAASVSVTGDGGLSVGDGAGPVIRDLQSGRIAQIALPLTAVEIGNPRLRIETTTPAGQVLTKTLTVPVRLNDPEIVRQSTIPMAANGGRFVIDGDTFAGLEPGTGRATLAVGALAAFDAPRLLTELDRYPYGCTEQTTSRALPLLYMAEVAAALGIGVAKDLDERVATAIARVLENQSSAGSFGLWRPNRGDLWLDAYVTDFLSRARAKGHAVPDVAFRSALENLLSGLSYAGDFETGGEDIAYALLVLAREGQASIGDLRYYADAKAEALATPMAKAQLGAALASYGEQRRADLMFRLAEAQVLAADKENRGWRHDYGSHLRDGAAVLALATAAGSTAVDARRLTRALTAKERRWTSTQEKVWMLMATSASLSAATETITINGAAPNGPLLHAVDGSDIAGGPVTVENLGPATDLVLTTFGVPVTPEPAGGKGYSITREYFSLDGEPVSPQTVAQNARLVTVLSIRSQEDRAGRLMVNDPLPAGFEIDNPNLLQSGALSALGWLQTVSEVEHAEFRSDRFLAAVDRSGAGTFRLAYIVRAVSPGRFHHPAAQVEDMYRPDYRAWTDTGVVDVVSAR